MSQLCDRSFVRDTALDPQAFRLVEVDSFRETVGWCRWCIRVVAVARATFFQIPRLAWFSVSSRVMQVFAVVALVLVGFRMSAAADSSLAGSYLFLDRPTGEGLRVTVFIPPCGANCRWRAYLGAVSNASVIGEGEVSSEGEARTIHAPGQLQTATSAFLLVYQVGGPHRSVVHATLGERASALSEWLRGVVSVLLGIIGGVVVSAVSGYYLPQLTEKRRVAFQRKRDKSKLYSEIELATEIMLRAPRGAEFKYELPPLLRGEGLGSVLDCVGNRGRLVECLQNLERAGVCFADDTKSDSDWDRQEAKLKDMLRWLRASAVDE